MLGLGGAYLVFASCLCAGLWARERCARRARALEGWVDALHAMRLMLKQERLPLDELLRQCAAATGAPAVSERLRRTGELLARHPALRVGEAYGRALRLCPSACEGADERDALHQLFERLGTGSADMRARCVESGLRRLEPLADTAREAARRNGALYARLGALGGAMLAIALW